MIANNNGPVRAYQLVARSADGQTCSATLDLLRSPGTTRAQATSNLLSAVIRAKGPDFIATFEVNEVF